MTLSWTRKTIKVARIQNILTDGIQEIMSRTDEDIENKC